MRQGQLAFRKNSGQFVKGHSGNPHGRPRKGESIGEIIDRIGDVKKTARINGKKVEIGYFDKIMLKAFEMAEGGDLGAIKFLASYRDGLPVSRHELIAGLDADIDEMSEKELKAEMEHWETILGDRNDARSAKPPGTPRRITASGENGSETGATKGEA